VAPASHDTASAVAAVPFASDVPAAYVSCGTWSLVGVETSRPELGPAALAANVTNEGGVEGSIRLLKNVTGLWLVQECRRAWTGEGRHHDYGELVAMAERAHPHVAFIDPDDVRFLPPGDMPERIAAYCRETGQEAPEDPGQVVRLILESLALKTSTVIETIAALTGTSPRAIHMVGGGSRNRLLCELTAQATGLPVLAGPAEATAIGNLLVQAIAIGELASVAEGRELVRRSFPVETYEPRAEAAGWGEARGRFAGLINR
jgi:rhamnulokinase